MPSSAITAVVRGPVDGHRSLAAVEEDHILAADDTPALLGQ
jgi:hypothetical protein